MEKHLEKESITRQKQSHSRSSTKDVARPAHLTGTPLYLLAFLAALAAALLLSRATASADAGKQPSPAANRQLALAGPGPDAGPVIPVEGPDGKLWICREDEEAQQSICLPWFQDMKPGPIDSISAAVDPTAGPVTPVVGPDGKLWLCREDEEAQQSICISWPQPNKQDSTNTLQASTGTAGPVIPVQVGDLLYLCREDEEAQQSICILWFPPEE
jgi:hypothetical protein